MDTRICECLRLSFQPTRQLPGRKRRNPLRIRKQKTKKQDWLCKMKKDTNTTLD
jgi:hypothetical protein